MDKKEYEEKRKKLYNTLTYNHNQLDIYRGKVEFHLLMIECVSKQMDELDKKY